MVIFDPLINYPRLEITKVSNGGYILFYTRAQDLDQQIAKNELVVDSLLRAIPSANKLSKAEGARLEPEESWRADNVEVDEEQESKKLSSALKDIMRAQAPAKSIEIFCFNKLSELFNFVQTLLEPKNDPLL